MKRNRAGAACISLLMGLFFDFFMSSPRGEYERGWTPISVSAIMQ